MEDVSIEDRKQQLESKSDELQQCQKELDNTTKQVKGNFLTPYPPTLCSLR